MRNCSPKHESLGWGPTQATAWLYDPPSKIVMLDFCPSRDGKGIRDKGELVLNEPIEEIQATIGGCRADGRGINDVVVRKSIAEPPDDTMGVAPGKRVLEIDIEGVSSLSKQAAIPFSSIIVGLDEEGGAV